jgi:diaminopimelate decarboxylase
VRLSHIWPRTAELRGDVLHVAGVSVADLARTYGTPLYVLDEDTFRMACRQYRSTLASAYPGQSAVYYSGKSLLNLTVAKLAADEGCHLDVVSAAEIHLAGLAGIPASRLHLHGNGKPPQELDFAIEHGIGAIVVDNLSELATIGAKAAARGRPVGVVLRLAPGIAASTHPHISTGLSTSKFGLSYDRLDDAIATFRDVPELVLRGVHVHLGSQISDVEPYAAAIEFLLDARQLLETALGVACDEISPGGGLAAAYRDEDSEPDIAAFVTFLAQSTVASCARRGMSLPRLVLEPGRSISARSAIAVYSVTGEKRVPAGVDFDAEGYIHIDGGMGDNIRPALYGARYEVIAAQKATQPRTRTVHIAGRYCESSDILVHGAKLPPLEPSDLIAMPGCGAYTLSMASNYNMTSRPALVMVKDGAHALVQRRETFDDLLRRDTGIGSVANPDISGKEAL